MAGRILIGTSGFAYPAWGPRFYPPGTGDSDRLPFYAARFGAVELNNTFYQRPSAARIDAWVAATPPDFRFVVKAQRGASLRAISRDPAGSVAWLTQDLDRFAGRLGAVLFRIPAAVARRPEEDADRRLRAFLAAWPTTIPLVVEAQDPSWQVDETFDALTERGATLCATDLADADEPHLRVTSSRLYLRLRRPDYPPGALRRWAARIRPFVDAGLDGYVFFAHDEVGRATELAAELRSLLGP
jgi:uncharacterized protein YecE (DUF72 family)